MRSSKKTPFRPPAPKTSPARRRDAAGKEETLVTPKAETSARRRGAIGKEETFAAPKRETSPRRRSNASEAREDAFQGQGRRGHSGRHLAAEAASERLHKVLAQAGIGSLREMEARIAAGRVQVNGQTAQIGQRIGPRDRVKVDGRLVTLHFSNRLPQVILYHKPEGEIVSRDDPEGRPSVFTALPRLRGGRWVAVGRLDLNTSGLILFTTSGTLANQLMHPGSELLREYAVRVLGDLTPEMEQQLLSGVMLEDGPARFISLEDGGGRGANHWYRASLYEGRNREVRRLFEAVGCKVSRLIRVRYGPFLLPPWLKRGQCRRLEDAEVKQLMDAIARQTGAQGETGARQESTKTSRSR
jgi:23S rRNA pseudouridine2605 synthase